MTGFAAPPSVVKAARSERARSGRRPPPTQLEIAFAGRSNVGKSTLMNALMRRKNLVRTSSTPGCTRGLDFFDVELDDGMNLTLVDLPGYGYAKRSKAERATWGPLIEGYLLERPALVAVVVLVDVRRGVEQEESDLLELLSSPPRVSRRPLRVVVVATKVDKLARSARKPALEKLRRKLGRPVLSFGAREGTGAADLWKALRRAVEHE